jgi:hypothetical protein
MVEMHERSRRLICRAVFLACGAAPLAIVAIWGASGRWVNSASTRAEQLGLSLGLRAYIGNIDTPLPGQTRYDDLELRDLENDSVVWKSRRLNVARHEQMLSLTDEQPEIDVRALGRLWRLVDDRLRTQALAPDSRLRWGARQLTLHGIDDAQTLVDLVGEIGPAPPGLNDAGPSSRAVLRFRVAGVKMDDAIWLSVSRRRTDHGAETQMNLDTKGARLKLATLQPLLPGLAELGRDAHFSGFVQWQIRDQNWRAEATGELTSVDLGRLVGENFPHVLSGTATVKIFSARFENGRLTQIDGELAAGPGTVGRSLVESLADAFGLSTKKSPESELIRYEQIAAGFEIDETGRMFLKGTALNAPAALMTDAGGVLLSEPTEQPRSALDLVRALAPSNEIQVPASRATEVLVARLPVPPLVPPKDADPKAPTARLNGVGADN